MLQVQRSTGEEETEERVASHEGWKSVRWADGQEAGEPVRDQMRETTRLEVINVGLGKDPSFLETSASFAWCLPAFPCLLPGTEWL